MQIDLKRILYSRKKGVEDFNLGQCKGKEVRNVDFDYLVQVIKQKTTLGYPLSTEEQNILALHERANNDLFDNWLSSVY